MSRTSPEDFEVYDDDDLQELLYSKTPCVRLGFVVMLEPGQHGFNRAVSWPGPNIPIRMFPDDRGKVGLQRQG
ncbi:MAG: hypothetical protein CM1200mP25_4820 [Acidobacteriota bacterium]|nr:MAG: hypothetical protein CM1200mP25_4820 [Acidobacteriota bacterium]